MASLSREPPTGTKHSLSSGNMNEIDLEKKCDMKIETYRLTNLVTRVRIRNSVTIHYAGYFLDSMQQWRAITQDYGDYCYKGDLKHRTDGEDPEAEPVPLWRTDSVLGLLEKQHGLVLFCSTWPDHGEKVLPGPITLTLGGEEHPLVPSLAVALKDMLLGEVRVVRVPPAELYGLDMEPLEPRTAPREVLLEEKLRAVKQRETREDSGEEGEEGPVPTKQDKPESYWSSSSEDEFDPDEEFSEPWCDAPGAKGDRATFLRVVRKPGATEGSKESGLEVHRGLRGLVYVLQLLAFGESVPPKEIIHVKKPLETTDKKTDKTEGSKDT